MAIRTIQSLRKHLQWAIELEHATIPPYLCALYSLHEGKNPEAAEVLLSIVMEEMLHMTLAANVLNAVGGQPQLDHPGFVPKYPTYLPHSNRAFLVSLSKFSPEAVAVFLRIEKPEEHDGVPEEENYETIGQFYEAIEQGLARLCRRHGESGVFTGDPARQFGPESFWYGGSGQIVEVHDLASARRALDEIKEQGEGLDFGEIWDGDRNMFHPEREEISHYFRFNEIFTGRSYQKGDTPQSGPTGEPFPVDWNAVHNLRPHSRMREFPKGSEVRTKMEDFNRAYSDMLRLLHQCFNGRLDLMPVAVGLMYEIKNRALDLVKTPTGDGQTTACPSFEYVAPEAAQHAAGATRRITIRPNGPYIVHGDIPLRRKTRVFSENKEALTWKKGELIHTEGAYALCRCGQSGTKPFCDGTHARIDFDGTETADTAPRADRAVDYPGTSILVRHDRTICAFATFCENRLTDVWEMSEKTGDTQVRAQVIAMVERCPSGALTYEIESEGGVIEPDLPEEIAVTDDGPLWVTGGIPIERSDGKPVETRNRVTLCRCGQSKNKPFCDGTHIDVKFRG